MRQRSSYPKLFKAQVVQECLQPGATISSVAIHHGINANVIRKWLPIYRDQSPATLPAFTIHINHKSLNQRSLRLASRTSHCEQIPAFSVGIFPESQAYENGLDRYKTCYA